MQALFQAMQQREDMIPVAVRVTMVCAVRLSKCVFQMVEQAIRFLQILLQMMDLARLMGHRVKVMRCEIKLNRVAPQMVIACLVSVVQAQFTQEFT